MIRRARSFALLVAASAVCSLVAAYGCGTDDVGGASVEEGGVSPIEGGVVLEDGAVVLPDGNVVLPDGGPLPVPDAEPGDSGSDADAGAVDAGEDAGIVDPPPPAGPLSPGYVDYDVNHVLVTGQSNAVANGGSPPLAAAQPYGNLMFDTGVMPMTTCDGNGCKAFQAPGAFVPLVEGDRFFNYTVETPASGLANEVSHLALNAYEFNVRAGYPVKHDVLVSIHGRSGNTYWCLRKGFCNYNAARGHMSPFGQGMMEVEAAKALAAAGGKSYVVRAVAAVHGESDHYAYVGNRSEFPLTGTDGTPGKIKDYKDALVEWQQDYEASVKAITGQAQPVPLFISAVSGFTTTRTSQVLQMQLDAHIAAPGKVVYVTPAYPLTVRSDCLHFDQHGYRKLGEYFAKVYARVVFGGETWEPVRPKQVTRAGNVITVKFFVPKPPLVFDTARVTNPGNYGFDVVDNGAIVASTAAITAPDTVTITMAAAPSGGPLRVRYAQNQPTSACIGPGTQYAGGARGNLRDSDDAPSLYGYELFNWGANFDVGVP